MPVWNLWNLARLEWTMRVGEQRSDVSAVVKRLRDALHDEHPTLPQESGDRDAVHVLIDTISDKTAKANRNNITRTDAYIEFFQQHPEIHWALLAHCVSRNGGWSMTDIKGEWCIRLDFEAQSSPFFHFLERANWLIFQDAYPQLLLYQEGKQRHQNLSHLLPYFHVSSFMKAMWDLFWEQGDKQLLTRALIINEQNHIESRVVQKPAYLHSVESSIQFRLESLLNMNQVLMPYRRNGKTFLAGTTMRHFQSVEDRIETGLRLYQILYQDGQVHDAVVRFMTEVPHSGSREDYWPHIFTSTLDGSAFSQPYEPRFTAEDSTRIAKRIKTGRALANALAEAKASGTGSTTTTFRDGKLRRIYSPSLHDVWRDVQHAAAESGDWFTDLRHVIYLFLRTKRQPLDITPGYVNSMQIIERSLALKKRAAALLGMRTTPERQNSVCVSRKRR